MLVVRSLRSLSRQHRNAVDGLLPYTKARWIITTALCMFYFERSYGMNYYIVTYLIGFYLLHLLVKYVTPKGLQDDEEDEEEKDNAAGYSSMGFQPYLSDGRQDETRPITPALSEIQIWQRVTWAFAVGTVCTCFKLLEIDVFWPMLVVYFILLAGYTIRKVFKQMVRHNYGLDDFVKHPPM